MNERRGGGVGVGGVGLEPQAKFLFSLVNNNAFRAPYHIDP